MEKMQEERSKMVNDPAQKEKREAKKNEMKQKMFKNLSPEERKTLEDYINQKKN